jgi:putative endonuclease
VDRTFYVYILASRSRVLYVGVTNNLAARVWEHKTGAKSGFTRKYHVSRLVYYEVWGSPRAAIAREKQIKSLRRSRKLALVNSTNPKWRDLSEPWFRPLCGTKREFCSRSACVAAALCRHLRGGGENPACRRTGRRYRDIKGTALG